MASGHRVIRTETSIPELHALVPARAKRLLRTPAPLERESLLPYALRLSEANGYLTPGYFLTAPTATQFSVSRHVAVTLIRESADLDEGQMARLIYASVEDDATSGRLLGKRVGLYDLQLRSPRICPTCVDDNGHIEALWDLAWVTACPVHARKLLDTCPVCSTRFSWSRPGIAKCPQGHDVSKLICVEATREEVAIARFLAVKLYGEVVPGQPEPTEGSHLSAMPLYETCRLAAKLVNCQSMRTSTTKRTVRGCSNLISHAGSMTSLHALLCGSTRDREMLFETLSIDPMTGAKHRSFHAAFHWLLTLFPKERAVEIMSPLLKELFTFAAEHWPHSRLGRTAEAFQPFVVPSKWMSAAAAAKRIGVIDYKITQGIATGDIPHKQVSDKLTHHVVVPVAWVVEQAAVLKRSMHSKRLRKRFSFSTRVLEILRENRIYTPSLKANSGQILEHDIRLLANRLLHGSTDKINSASTCDVTFHDLMYGHASDTSKAAMVMAILNGYLKSKGNVAGKT
ncbi:MAG TPA: TniQ family protein, partial [Rhodanobacter sp.]|nr:TniQ family protein [Rhodanobacter sp.]